MEKKMTTKDNENEIRKLREDITKLKMRVSELVDELKRTNYELLNFKKNAHRDVTLLRETTTELERRMR